MAVQTKIQFRRDTAANWTSTNPTLAAGEIGYDTTNNKFKIGTGSNTWTQLIYQTDASLLSGAASLTTLTTTGAVVVGGNLTVNGTTTSINSSTLQVDDKNLELGSVAEVVGVSATVENGTSTVLTATSYNFIVGQSVTRTAGAAYAGGTIASIVSPTEFTVTGTFGATGSVTLTIGGATDVTADGAGITVKGTTDKTLQWSDTTDAWTSNQDFNIAASKVYEINAVTVLSNTQVLGYSITNANTISTIVARDGSGNFSAGTITASLTGTASLASNLTGGTLNKGEIVYMSGVNTTAKLTATTTNNQVLAYNTATNAPYWAAVTGSGSVVLATSPTLVTPALGTPSSGNLASTTGYATANLTGLGTNVATFLATPSSANFQNTITGATGTGAVVFSTSPTLVTPALGVATATSLNKVTVTAPATSATLTLANGSSLITSGAYSVTLTGTATTNVTLPTSGTLATQTYVGSATVAQANNLTGATANLIPYQSAANTTSFIPAPAGSNYVLTASATGAPTWAAPAAGGVTSIVAGNGITVSGATGAVTVNVNAAYSTTWTTTQLINVSSDVVALNIKANTTQTANLIQVIAGDGTTPLLSLSPAGTLFAVTIDGGSA
jgi:hypothetical protein